MRTITDRPQVEHYRKQVREMMLAEQGKEYDFSAGWVAEHAWKVVPAESGARLHKDEIPRMVSTLRLFGYSQCVVVVTEAGYLQPITVENEYLGDSATCYLLSVDEADFHEFNRELGPFRSVLLDEARSWAISCNEWYNLFGGPSGLVEGLLGVPINQARQEFLEFASALAKGVTDTPLIRVAERYAAL